MVQREIKQSLPSWSLHILCCAHSLHCFLFRVRTYVWTGDQVAKAPRGRAQCMSHMLTGVRFAFPEFCKACLFAWLRKGKQSVRKWSCILFERFYLLEFRSKKLLNILQVLESRVPTPSHRTFAFPLQVMALTPRQYCCRKRDLAITQRAPFGPGLAGVWLRKNRIWGWAGSASHVFTII